MHSCHQLACHYTSRCELSSVFTALNKHKIKKNQMKEFSQSYLLQRCYQFLNVYSTCEGCLMFFTATLIITYYDS